MRDGASVEAASDLSGIPIGEARLHHAADLKDPPPPECFELIGPTQKEDPMARTARKPKDDDTGEIKPKDFAQAKRLYFADVKPARTAQGEAMKDASDAFKSIKKDCLIQTSAARAVFRLVELEDAKRDDWIRGFVGLLAEFNIPLQSNDLVDRAEAPPAKPRPHLVPVGDHPADDSDLANGGDGDEFEEASEDELAAQEGRKAKSPKA